MQTPSKTPFYQSNFFLQCARVHNVLFIIHLENIINIINKSIVLIGNLFYFFDFTRNISSDSSPDLLNDGSIQKVSKLKY